MFKLDHFIINIDKKYRKDKKIREKIIENGFPYEPLWGKGTSGFKVSNIWIGNEYLEMINILKKEGGGWREEWVKLYNEGHRGLLCIMLDVDDINKVYERIKEKNINITKPKHLQFKWFFNIFTRVMPWQNSYLDFLEKIPMQIAFQQMDDEESREFMKSYMTPNSKENKIMGIEEVIIEGELTEKDKNILYFIFKENIEKISPLTIKLNKNQRIIFKEQKEYKVRLKTECEDEKLKGAVIEIENVIIENK